MEEIGFGPCVVKLDGGRIALPARYSKRILWLGDGGKALQAWLLMLQPGRFRLLSDAEVTASEEIGQIRSLIIDGPNAPDVAATVFQQAERAARLGRLIQTTLTLSSSSGWRLFVPKQIAAEEETLVLMFSLGRLEIWFMEVYNTALIPPLSAVL